MDEDGLDFLRPENDGERFIFVDPVGNYRVDPIGSNYMDMIRRHYCEPDMDRRANDLETMERHLETIERIREVQRRMRRGEPIGFSGVLGISGRIQAPPIGITPRYIWEENRITELLAAQERYKAAGMEVPVAWTAELQELKLRKERTQHDRDMPTLQTLLESIHDRLEMLYPGRSAKLYVNSHGQWKIMVEDEIEILNPDGENYFNGDTIVNVIERGSDIKSLHELIGLD